jgi:hypothetical protein
MIVNTQISYGYASLIEIFFKANDLDITIEDRRTHPHSKVILHYNDDSDTAMSVTCMSIKHLGFENMLCDYLIKCGIQQSLITIGQAPTKRDMTQLDKDWEEHRKRIGLR